MVHIVVLANILGGDELLCVPLTISETDGSDLASVIDRLGKCRGGIQPSGKEDDRLRHHSTSVYQAVCPLSSSSPIDTERTFAGKSISATMRLVIILDISSAVVVGTSSRVTSSLGKTYLLPHDTASTESSETVSFTSCDAVGSSVLWSSSSIICLSFFFR